MALTDRDLQEVGRYVQAHLIEWLPEPLLQLNERAVRVEEELRSQRELMLQGFAQVDRRIEEVRVEVNARLEQVDRRFEQVDKRFDDVNLRFDSMIDQMDKRFDDSNKRFDDSNKRFDDSNKRFEALTHLMDKRFEDSNERFGDMNRRFNSLTWLISAGFVALATIMSLYAFFL